MTRDDALRSVRCPMCKAEPTKDCRAMPTVRRGPGDVGSGRAMVGVHPARVFALREQRKAL